MEDNLNAGILVEEGVSGDSPEQHLRNLGSGIVVAGGSPSSRRTTSRTTAPSTPWRPASGDAVKARGNWWGSPRGIDILAGVQGKVDVQSISAPLAGREASGPAVPVLPDRRTHHGGRLFDPVKQPLHRYEKT